MRPSPPHLLSSTVICVIVGLSASPAFTKTVKQCSAEYVTNKANIDAAGLTREGFMVACRANQTKNLDDSSSNSIPKRQIPVGGIKAPLSRD